MIELVHAGEGDPAEVRELNEAPLAGVQNPYLGFKNLSFKVSACQILNLMAVSFFSGLVTGTGGPLRDKGL